MFLGDIVVWLTAVVRNALILTTFMALPVSAREVIPANEGWKFLAGDPVGAEMPEFNDSCWADVRLPHDFQISQPWVEPSPDEKGDTGNSIANTRSRLSARAFKEMGTGWYRLSFVAPQDWQGRRVLVDFEGILLTGDAYLNGKRIGGTDYGYLGFESDISKDLKYGERNVLAVRADTGNPKNSRWYTGAGLYRDVNFIITDPKQYFTRHPLQILTPDISTGRASVVVNAEIADYTKNDTITAEVEIVGTDGKRIYSARHGIWRNRRQRVREIRLDSLTVENPQLWDVGSPELYTLTAKIIRHDGTVADSVSERFGIRKIEFSPESGFKLNGRKVLLKGIANHHTLGALGAAAYPRAIEKRLDLLKEFGFNHVRTSHNPYSKSFLDLCDEKGILVVDELYDKWKKQYSGGRREWTEQWQHDVPEWVRRDRNHPSIIFWSLGNELQNISDLPFNDWGVTPYRLQRSLLRRYDATRPTTVAMHPRGRNEKTDSLPAPLVMETDIASYNYRYMYFPGDSRRFPWMMFYQSEANTANMGPNYFDMDLDRVLGLAYWGMIDYLGESNGWPAKGWVNGVFDISLEPKPAAYFLRSFLRPEEPLVRIGVVDDAANTVWNDVQVGTQTLSSHWNRKPGTKVTLYTFTNADYVELLLNGRSLGVRANDTADSKERNRILWKDVPYVKGRLEARAFKDGVKKPVAVHCVETAGNAVRLSASPDKYDWQVDGKDLKHIRIEALDRQGRRDPEAGQKVSLSIAGPAEIVGVINGDMTSDELTVGDSRSLYHGSCAVILRSTGEPGAVTLTAKASGLKTATVSLELQRHDSRAAKD